MRDSTKGVFKPERYCRIFLYLSAMCSCLASKASLLRVFHMASVSVDISSVSKNAVALETERFAGFQ